MSKVKLMVFQELKGIEDAMMQIFHMDRFKVIILPEFLIMFLLLVLVVLIRNFLMAMFNFKRCLKYFLALN